MAKIYKITYDVGKYNFRKLIEEVIEDENLEQLHQVKQYDTFEVRKESRTIWHPKYYSKFNSNIQQTYIQFLSDVIKPHFGWKYMVFQKIPTFRIHLHGNVSVGGWHKDRDYNHTEGEINCWLPFTDAFGTNTIWIESEEDRGDYQSYDVKYGEVLIFDGVNLLHGNKTNEENITRVSFDFRVVDENNFSPSDKSSLNNPTQFSIGEYFEKI
jgi:hypothetical protein